VCFIFSVAPTFSGPLLQLSSRAGQLTGLLLGGVVSALAVIIPLGMVEKRVENVKRELKIRPPAFYNCGILLWLRLKSEQT